MNFYWFMNVQSTHLNIFIIFKENVYQKCLNSINRIIKSSDNQYFKNIFTTLTIYQMARIWDKLKSYPLFPWPNVIFKS